jgi:hypothetical protein
MKIQPVGAEMFCTDRQTDKMKLEVTFFAFLQMCPKSQSRVIVCGDWLPLPCNKSKCHCSFVLTSLITISVKAKV